ncbi:MAG: hypothetical protein EZS28_020518 [Streblomastix strix]|uniref:Uncharacterized protein n=1 Tax=Streblomastix strix TaxID=222440 RepID=A0A5J4VMW8_9EUKA|nr:MAG: hypothetical protein EZS28_020518 [Streblomastix strix]
MFAIWAETFTPGINCTTVELKPDPIIVHLNAKGVLIALLIETKLIEPVGVGKPGINCTTVELKLRPLEEMGAHASGYQLHYCRIETDFGICAFAFKCVLIALLQN